MDVLEEARKLVRRNGGSETFDFLGFTHYYRKTRTGCFGLGRKPINKRMSRFLKRIRQELIRRMHHEVHETGRWLGRVLYGWLNCYAAPTSFRYLRRCYSRPYWIWWRVLRRRFQKDKTSLTDMESLTDKYWPQLKIRHPWSGQVFWLWGGATGRTSLVRNLEPSSFPIPL